jgi:hypothetical protein
MKRLVLVVIAVIMLLSIMSCPAKTPETTTQPPVSPTGTTETPSATQPSTPSATPTPSPTQPTSDLPNLLFTTPAGWTGPVIIGTGQEVAGLAGDSELYVAVWLSNSGATDAAGLTVTLNIDGSLVKNFELDEDVPAGGGLPVYARLKDLKGTASLDEGNHEFSFFADSAQSIKESNETDNEVTSTVHVPALVVEGPDVTPSPITATASIVVDNQVVNYRDIRIKAGVANIGSKTARDVVVELKKGGTKLFEWTIDYLTPSEQEILEVTVGEIMEQATISAGVHNLTLDCKVTTPVEEDTGNNSETVDNVRLALPPVPKAISLTDTGKTLQAAIENYTWYGEDETQDMVDLTTELLQGVYSYWSNLRMYILPFDEYNQRYAEKFGETAAEINNLKKEVANDRLRGQRYLEGYINGATMYFREGTFVQIFPNFVYEIGELLYAQKNYAGYRTSLPMKGEDLASNLLEAYVIAMMCEKYGLKGFINMSVVLNKIPHTSIGGSSWDSVNLRRVWAIVTEAGYPEGGAPAKVFLDAYNDFTSKNDPIPYLEELDNKANLLDTQAITNIISWRMVDKDLTMLPEDIVDKLNPNMSSISFDNLISCQYFVALPY